MKGVAFWGYDTPQETHEGGVGPARLLRSNHRHLPLAGRPTGPAFQPVARRARRRATPGLCPASPRTPAGLQFHVLDLEPVTGVMLGAPDRGLNRAVLLGLWGRSPLCAVCSVHLLKVGRDLVRDCLQRCRGHPPRVSPGVTPCLTKRRRRAAAVQGASRGAPKPSDAFPPRFTRGSLPHNHDTIQPKCRAPAPWTARGLTPPCCAWGNTDAAFLDPVSRPTAVTRLHHALGLSPQQLARPERPHRRAAHLGTDSQAITRASRCPGAQD